GQTTFEIDAPYDQFATPVNALDVSRAIKLLVADGKVGIYHIASTDFMSRVQLLQCIAKGLNKEIKINPISTESLKQPAKRPLKGGLISAKFLSEYPTFEFSTVSDFLQKR
ncbi:MAG: sugar nucleotide-binding protein, partial [Pedobacter agri]